MNTAATRTGAARAAYSLGHSMGYAGRQQLPRPELSFGGAADDYLEGYRAGERRREGEAWREQRAQLRAVAGR